MHCGLPLFVLLALALSPSAFAQGEGVTRHQSPTPPWLPRGAFLGTYVRNGAVVPQARIQWQLTLFQDRRDALIFVVEGGLGRSLAVPDSAVEGANVPFRYFYAHPAMAGLGYRNQNPSGWHWGFQVVAGPVWYGARYQGFADEDRMGGLLEGRVHVGYQVGKVALGLGVGYAEPFSVSRRSVARDYLGGLLVGFFADWR
jgi:hypothetical protein